MPITLPPLSRRRFLAGTLAAGAGMLLPRWLRAAQGPADPDRWLLLADTHLWEDRSSAHRGVKPAENFAVARREILALNSRPAGAIVAGDCAYMQGNPGDYTVLAEELKPLREAGLPVHLVLGNHDERDHFWAAFAELKPKAEAPVPQKHVAIVEALRANWFLLDSLRQTRQTPGELGQAQLDWLARSLDARADKPALVVAHHDPDTRTPVTGLTDTAALFEILRPRKQVKAYVFGHTHRWKLAEQDGIHLINVPATAWVFSSAEAQGWIDLQLAADGATLVLRCLDPQRPKHGSKTTLKWRT